MLLALVLAVAVCVMVKLAQEGWPCHRTSLVLEVCLPKTLDQLEPIQCAAPWDSRQQNRTMRAELLPIDSEPGKNHREFSLVSDNHLLVTVGRTVTPV